MPNIHIYIPAMKLNKIDLYCKEKKIARGAFLTNCALGFINATRGEVKCGFCHSPALGKYHLTIYDPTLGEQEKEVYLCQYHLNKAKTEGTGISEIQE